MRDSLVRYGNILARSTQGGMFWSCARDEQRSSARLLADRLFGVAVTDAEALDRVQFSEGFAECWMVPEKGIFNAEVAETQRGET